MASETPNTIHSHAAVSAPMRRLVGGVCLFVLTLVGSPGCESDSPSTQDAIGVSFTGPDLTESNVQAALTLALEQIQHLEERMVSLDESNTELIDRIQKLEAAEGNSSIEELEQNLVLLTTRLDNIDASQVGWPTIGNPAPGTVLYEVTQLQAEASTTAANLESLGRDLATLSGSIQGQFDGLQTSFDALEDSLSEPLPCPVGTSPVGNSACIENDTREELGYVQAAATCVTEGRRLCALDELMESCFGNFGTTNPEFKQNFLMNPQWSRHVVRPVTQEGTSPQGVALYRASADFAQCGTVAFANSPEIGSVTFAYRCCIDR